MRAVFFGTPAWAVPSLEALVAAGIDVVGVVTNPDRPAGRGMAVRASPVKEAALAGALPVLQPERARDPELHHRLAALEPDVAVVVAYGSILPAPLLEVPRLGFVNVHFSLLPAYRGAAPVQRAIIDGAAATGVSMMVLTEGMDEGPVLARETVPIEPTDTAGTLGERMAAIGARVLVPVLAGYAAGDIRPEPQDHRDATYAPKILTDEARIDWSRSATTIDRLVRGLNPAPGAWTTIGGRRLKVFGVAPAPAGGRGLRPGHVETSAGLTVETGDRPLALADVQLAGKRRMSGAELGRGLDATAPYAVE